MSLRQGEHSPNPDDMHMTKIPILWRHCCYTLAGAIDGRRQIVFVGHRAPEIVPRSTEPLFGSSFLAHGVV